MPRLLRIVCLGLLIASLFWIHSYLAQQGTKGGEWRVYGGGEWSTHYSPIDQINRDNIKDLKVAWVWKSDSLLPNPQAGSETTPIMVNGVLYFTMDQRRYVIAADAGTGETLWIYRPNEGERFDQRRAKIHRGVAYWTDGRGEDRILYRHSGFPARGTERQDGRSRSQLRQNGTVDLFKRDWISITRATPIGKIGNSSPVVVSHDTVIVGSCFDARRPRQQNECEG